MDPPTVDDISARYGVTDDQLDKPCSDTDLVNIAGILVSWRDVTPHLGLKEADEVDIEKDVQTEREKRLKALRTWKTKFDFKATYKVLVEALVKANKAEQAGKVCQILNAPDRKLCVHAYHIIILYPKVYS